MRRETEDRIRAIAAIQHGVVTRSQLVQAGVSPAGVGRRLASGRLRALHRGVYLVGPVMPERGRQLAAVLAGGQDALLSHTSALPIWGLLRADAGAPVHVTVPGSGRACRPGIRFHRVRALADDERAVVDGIPVTAPARTLVDAAPMLGSREIERAAAAAERGGLIPPHVLAGLPERYRGRPGVVVLRALVEQASGLAFTRSEAERRSLDLFAEAGLPRPRTNVPVGPYELDLFWPDERVAVEIDGRAFHSSRASFEGDRQKDIWLRARGIEVVRLSWRQITDNGAATAVQVGQILALAGARQRGPNEARLGAGAGARAGTGVEAGAGRPSLGTAGR